MNAPARPCTEGTTPLARFVSHKTVCAARIVAVDHVLATITIEVPGGAHELRHGRPAMFSHGQRPPEPGWYFIEYADGYRSVSPPEPFEAGYIAEPDAAIALAVREHLLTLEQTVILRRLWTEYCEGGALLGLPLRAPGHHAS